MSPRPRIPLVFFTVLVAGILLATAGGYLSRINRMGPFQHMVSGFKEYLEEDTFSGRVFDQASGAGLAGAWVYLVTDGWDPLRGGGWQSVRSALDTTDASGSFRLTYRRLSGGTEAAVIRQGYAPMALQFAPREPLAIPLVRLGESPDRVFAALLAVPPPNRDGRLYIDLWEISMRETADSADIAIQILEDIEPRIVVEALGEGGVIRSDVEWPSLLDSTALRCDAPQDGYGRADTTLVPKKRALYFVRLRDGRHYARIQMSPEKMLRISGYGTGAIVWVNRAGGMALCGPDPAVRSVLSVAGANAATATGGHHPPTIAWQTNGRLSIVLPHSKIVRDRRSTPLMQLAVRQVEVPRRAQESRNDPRRGFA